MTRRFVSIGEAMVELAPQGDCCYRAGFAGDTLNTAWYLCSRLPPGWSVGYVTLLGDDPFSSDLCEFIAQAGIDVSGVHHLTNRNCGLYLIRLVGEDRQFSYWRAHSAARLLARDAARLCRMIGAADYLYVSGITFAILPASDRPTLLDELTRRRRRGALVAFDPNYRPALWENAKTARHWITRVAMAADVVLPSFDNESALFGDDAPADTIGRYRSLGCGEITVKNGEKPVSLFAGDDLLHVATKPVKSRDPTGAGDAFNAAYLAARMAGVSAADAATQACALAGRVIQHPGALVPLPPVL